MVHNRSTRKSCTILDARSLRNTLTVSDNKHEMSTSPRFGFKLEVPSRYAVGSEVAASSNQWVYNNMINNNRQDFNNLHFS